jgi:hypothetical protein
LINQRGHQIHRDVGVRGTFAGHGVDLAIEIKMPFLGRALPGEIFLNRECRLRFWYCKSHGGFSNEE